MEEEKITYYDSLKFELASSLEIESQDYTSCYDWENRDMDKKKWQWLPSGTVSERKPLRNGKNNPENNEDLESKENYIIAKVASCGLLSMILRSYLRKEK